MNKGKIDIGEVVSLSSLGTDMDSGTTYALVKTEDMEVIRMVIPEGKTIPEHNVKGQLSLQCLEGEIEFNFDGKTVKMKEDDWICLDKETMHSLTPITHSVLLLTILF